MKYEINEWFIDRKYQMFVDYCLNNDIRFVNELNSFDFDKLLSLKGMGLIKVDKI